MALNTKDFATIVSDQVTAIQAASARLIDTTIGSIIRSVAEANAAVVLWIQSLLVALLATTRASTSTGTDLDTWMADYSVTRLPAVAATGNVTFARFTATNPATIPVGARVQTGDGSQIFEVIEDSTNPAYAAGVYTVAAAVTSLAVKVQAVTAGVGNNVVIGAINTLATAISGIDTVTNAAAFTNGADAESDSALRTRFVAYVASLSKATKEAVGYAITSLQTGLQYTLVENQSYAGATDYGYFYVVVDDGTGTPGGTLLTSVSNAVDKVRPVTSRFGVFAPIVLTAGATMTATIAAGYDPVATKLLVKNAVTNYINGLGLGQSLVYTRLLQVAYNASPGVTNITALLVNGGTADVTVTVKQVVKAATITVN
ncbi:baseplate J/gp47 family protein [Variovorax paradoxus]|nr:baseplate J/gp47 family protein [Variovorax paradoxus]MBT2299284.1 baseplate J/gp47 family protein [Variovorax paradoxus]